MISTITTSLLIILFFLLGYVTQAFKKLFGLLTNIILKVANLFGIKIKTKEHSERVSEEFKLVYKDIKRVKLSKKNIKQQSSIDWVFFCLSITAGLLVILNLEMISGNGISNWLCIIINKIGFKMSPENTNTFYTATLFSVISFSISKVLQRWKETKQQRVEAKELKIKNKALSLMSSKDLLDEAIKKDEQNYKELKDDTNDR